MRIAIGSDHAGFELKEYIKEILTREGHSLLDEGTVNRDSVDYPDFGYKVAHLVAQGAVERGILVCGTGVGMSIVANRVRGVRAALVSDVYSAVQARKHLDANILVLGEKLTGKGLAEEIVKLWISTPFEGGRHQKRIDKIDML